MFLFLPAQLLENFAATHPFFHRVQHFTVLQCFFAMKLEYCISLDAADHLSRLQCCLHQLVDLLIQLFLGILDLL